ncbi:unnamed protein product [Arabidopsis lyrata]|nr:unnamed protein product [Arabidopsis lyrata]
MTADIHILYKKDKGDVKFASSSRMTKGDHLSEMQKTFLSNSENHLVGLKENVKKLVGYLVKEDSILELFTRKHMWVWQTILERLSPKHDEHREVEMTEGELQGKLFGLLETGKSFANSQFSCSRKNRTGTKSRYKVDQAMILLGTLNRDV